MRTSLEAEARDSGRAVSGVGDFAIVTSAIAADAELKAVVGSLFLSVHYQGTDGPPRRG
jgi:hypothetical protein